MDRISNLLHAMLLKGPSLQAIAQDERFNLLANLANLFLGLAYGLIAILYNFEFIQSFQTPMLKNFFVPLFFIFSGIIMMFITRVGFMFLLWAGSRAFGGPGLVRVLNRLSGIILLPGILALPAFINLSNGQALSFLTAAGMALALIWIYLLSVKSLIVSQKLQAWKAYIAVIGVFIFFSSVYYLILPPLS